MNETVKAVSEENETDKTVIEWETEGKKLEIFLPLHELLHKQFPILESPVVHFYHQEKRSLSGGNSRAKLSSFP